MERKFEHLVVNEICWQESLPDHEGSIGGKVFPVIMSSSIVPEAKALWERQLHIFIMEMKCI
ncbi:hypothetical protein G9F73_005275 [Clostridium estertheticum]|uniref:hypothetical protein n=1 Tax=Clostridium estertheticum TaxID=238834 RepID=UPI0013EEC6E9|nr:hypothetical protein [Clostridium estertheticum]MBZ9607236.1 hypothetical protein [Clostridium estertheticum]